MAFVFREQSGNVFQHWLSSSLCSIRNHVPEVIFHAPQLDPNCWGLSLPPKSSHISHYIRQHCTVCESRFSTYLCMIHLLLDKGACHAVYGTAFIGPGFLTLT